MIIILQTTELVNVEKKIYEINGKINMYDIKRGIYCTDTQAGAATTTTPVRGLLMAPQQRSSRKEQQQTPAKAHL